MLIGEMRTPEHRLPGALRKLMRLGGLVTEFARLYGSEAVATIAVGRAEIAGMLGELRGEQ